MKRFSKWLEPFDILVSVRVAVILLSHQSKRRAGHYQINRFISNDARKKSQRIAEEYLSTCCAEKRFRAFTVQRLFCIALYHFFDGLLFQRSSGCAIASQRSHECFSTAYVSFSETFSTCH